MSEPTTQFGIYEKLVQEAGLYGQAFFGHRATHAQKKLLDKLQRRSIYLWKVRNARKNKAKANPAPEDSGG